MKPFTLSFLFLVFISIPCASQPYIISTVAGTDRLLDGKPATTVPLRAPHALAADGAGNLYIADTDDNRVRKINPSGIISTYAGTGIPTYSGDRGKATLADLSGPIGLAVDSSGNLYIADRDNFRVRKVTLDGTINTVAGSGRPGTGGDNGPAVNAQVSPLAVAVDTQGNLYISTFDYFIRKVDSKGIITTIAGTGTPAFFGDNGPANQAAIGLAVQMATDSSGNLYFADFFNYHVRKIDSAGIITTVAGSGNRGLIGEGVQAIAALIVPDGVALDTFGNLFLTDFNRDLVRKVVLSAGIIQTIAGNGTTGFLDDPAGTRAEFNTPQGLAVDSGGSVFVADFGNQRVRKISGGGVTTVAGTGNGDGGPATSAFLNQPFGIAVDPANNIVIADGGNFEARRFTAGGAINRFGLLFGHPGPMAVDQAGNFYIADDEPYILMVKPDGTTKILAGSGEDNYSGDGGPATSAAITPASGVAVDSSNNVYFTDFVNHRIRKVTASSGIISTIAGNGKTAFSGDNGPAAAAGMDPFDIAIDTRNNNLYVADLTNNRIRRITPDGAITTVAGTSVAGYSGDGGPATAALLNFPTGVAVDSSGNLYVADNGNSVVRRITAGGLITTIAGNGEFTPATGDGGPAIAAQIDPRRIAVDAAGDLLVTDPLNDRVRKLTPQVVAPKAIGIVGGNNQTAAVGAPLTARLVIKVTDASGAGVPGVVIGFTANPANSATANPVQAITLNDGTASTAVTLGATPGAITVVASAGGLNTSFSLTVLSPTAPVISTGGIASAGLSAPPVTTLASNSIASIFGDRFAPAGTSRQVGPDDLINGRIPTNLAGVCVVFGTQRAPIFGVFPGQLNVQVPQLASGPTTVQVITKCDTPQAETSSAMTVAIQAASPEFFYFLHNGNGHNPIAAVNAVTGSYVGAPGLLQGVAFSAAKPGDILTLFATGFGATDPSFAAGELPGVAAQVTAAVKVTFGGVTLAQSDVLYTGVSQNAGLYQLNIRVPDGVPDGDESLVITIGNASSPAGAYITVKRTQ
jgi:uncharacterized protein (TIGR03437 family)